MRSLFPMPRYFFHVQGARPFHDDGGLDLPGDPVAWAEAKRFVRGIEVSLEPGETWQLEVHRDGQAIYSLKLCTRAIGSSDRGGECEDAVVGSQRP